MAMDMDENKDKSEDKVKKNSLFNSLFNSWKGIMVISILGTALTNIAFDAFGFNDGKFNKARVSSIKRELDHTNTLNSYNPNPASRKEIDSMVMLAHTQLLADSISSSSDLLDLAEKLSQRAWDNAKQKLDLTQKAEFADTTAIFKRQLRANSPKVRRTGY